MKSNKKNQNYFELFDTKINFHTASLKLALSKLLILIFFSNFGWFIDERN